MRERIPFGRNTIDVSFPDDTVVVKPGGVETPVEPEGDLPQLIEKSLKNPLDGPPLRERVKSSSRVTVAFDDPTVQCYAPVWYLGLTALVEELTSAGVKEDNITFLCANALHRKFTHEELAKILGDEFVKRYHRQIKCHDAEDEENLVYLGKTEEGYHVELNKLCADSDLVIYLNTASFLGFNGGWKSICVGLSTWRSIKHHHKPEIMSMSLKENRMHEILNKMGKFAEEKLGTDKFFKIETVLANPFTVANMWGGSLWTTRQKAEEFLRKYHKPRRESVKEKVDIIVYGIPDWSPYAAFSFMNPILTLISTGLGYLGGYIEAIGKKGCSVILATPCPERWDDVHHPSYREVWERVIPATKDPNRAMEMFEKDFISNAKYIEKYRFNYGFHPIHGLLALHPLKRLRHAGRIYVAGIENPRLAEHVGFIPARSVEEALQDAMAHHGREARVALIKYPPAVSRE